MKRTVGILTGALALGVAVFVGSRLLAQNNAPASAQPRTRVALVNLPQVIKTYQKYQAFEREWQEAYKMFDKQYEGKRALLASYSAQMQKATDQAQREKLEKDSRALQHEMQEMGEDAKKQLGKKRDDQAVIIYKEIEEAVAAFAKANDIEMVMHFSDNIVPAEIYNPANIQRKLAMGACFPMYNVPNMDITNYIVQMLNQRYAQSATAPAGGQPVQPAAYGQPKPK